MPKRMPVRSRISIHSLLAEGDRREEEDKEMAKISIHSLLAEGDRRRNHHRRRAENFNPLPPRGGRLGDIVVEQAALIISIHSLLAEGDLIARHNPRTPGISIHSLLAEGDHRRGARQPRCYKISIHSLLAEGDLSTRSTQATLENFNPLPPRGGRRRQYAMRDTVAKFQSTPSSRRETLFMPSP